MNFNPKLIKYEKNTDLDAKFLGIATVSILDNKIILRYKVQAGRDGKGIYFAPFSAKMHDQWHSGFIIDSNFENEEIMAMLRHNFNKTPATYEPQITTKQAHNFSNEEVPF